MDRATLLEYNIDYASGLGRCLNDAGFYEKLLSMFLEDQTFARAQAAHAASDYPALFRALHELKGASGTASLNGLYDAVCPLVELLRSGNPPGVEVDALFANAEAAYRRTCEGIALASQR